MVILEIATNLDDYWQTRFHSIQTAKEKGNDSHCLVRPKIFLI